MTGRTASIPRLARLAAGVVRDGFRGRHGAGLAARRIEDGLAGVCWFAQNIGDAGQAAALADQLHGVRDRRGGDVRRGGR